MNEFIQWHTDTLGDKVVKALEKNNFQAYYVADRLAAIDKVLSLIPAGSTIGVGGSWTLQELDIPEALARKGHEVFDHSKPGLTKEESMSLRRKELLCDVFLSSTNAITLDGQLVNVEGTGNRVGAMMFGPRQVIIVAGVNKIVPDFDAAIKRIRNFVAPITNKRMNFPNPCVQTGICTDCQLPSRTCNITTILHKKPRAIAFTIILVGEDLGF